MKLKKLLEINAMCEEKDLPWDVREPFDYDSDNLGLTDINEMDIIHFIRAFKLLNKKCNNLHHNAVTERNHNQSKIALNLIAGKLHIAVNELEEYIDNG
jgi:hypothetical protein|tara:strand:- start:93 stop:389 length:297 start_codon:yes stop_codon:yes gene_type:complete